MIPVYLNSESFISERREELTGGGIPADVLHRVETIIERVRNEGDRALVALTEELDGIRLEPDRIRVPPELIAETASEAPGSIREVLEQAASNVRAFHERQREQSWRTELDDGTVLGQKVVPLDAVGLYVPGGKAIYPSTLIMTSIPARIAGVERLVVVSPPGSIDRTPALACAIQMLGISEVYQVGGAQAVAALAYGTRTVSKVDKIVGPGNIYVAAAKKLVFGQVGVDSIAGPSEIVILADDTANPRYVASDLISQAEHGSGDERALLVSTSARLVDRVREELARQLEDLPRAADVDTVLRTRGAAVVVEGVEGGIELIDRIAPEHLEILTRDAVSHAERVRNAGAIFVGEYSPVAVGDFFAGPNHVLPTGTTARFSSPLGVYDFVKRSSLVQYSRKRLARDRESIETFARIEGFEAHARSIAVRFEGGD
jgi:histidinol dehydrogenase